MKRCYLVRHAQTEWNRENRLQGHSDQPLSSFGKAQAKRLAGWFASHHLEGLFTSSLQRSLQTAWTIANGNGHRLKPVVDPDLAEMHLGLWEGLTPEEIDGQFQGAYQQWKLRPSSVSIPRAEVLDDFRARTRRALERIAGSFTGGACVVVTHGGVIASMLAEILDADYDTMLKNLRLDNAGISVLEWDGATPHVLWINATDHLDTYAFLDTTESVRSSKHEVRSEKP